MHYFSVMCSSGMYVEMSMYVFPWPVCLLCSHSHRAEGDKLWYNPAGLQNGVSCTYVIPDSCFSVVPKNLLGLTV